MLPIPNGRSSNKNLVTLIGSEERILLRDFKVRMTYTLSWEEALNQGAPATVSLANARFLSGSYEKNLGFSSTQTIFLIRFFREMADDHRVIEWGKEHDLQPAGARALLALGAIEPRLDHTLSVPNLCVSSLDLKSIGGSLRTLYLWWDQEDVRAMVGRSHKRCSQHTWFAFRK